MDILQQIKSALYKIRRATPAKHKVMPVLKEPKPPKKAKPEPKRKVQTVSIDGRELSFSEVARNYGLSVATVRARYRVGNRGRLLIRPSQKKDTPTHTVKLK